MNRRSFLGGAAASGVAVVGSYFAIAQSADDEVASLATKVADLDTRVDALETQVAEIRDAEASTPVAVATDGQQAGTPVTAKADGGSVTVEGTGTTVSAPFTLVAGRYRVTVTVQERKDGFASIAVESVDPSGGSEEVVDIMNQASESADAWTGSVLYHAPADGDYFIVVSHTNDPWSVVFEPF